MLSEFKAGDKIRHILLCKVQKIGTSSNGGVFARGTVTDNSGSIAFICFDSYAVEMMRAFTGPCAIQVTGTIDINRFQNDGSLQLLIQKVEQPLLTDDLSHLLPSGTVSIKNYEKRFLALIDKINDDGAKALLKEIFADTVFHSFKTNPAAMTYHHAYIGGLLQHSVDTAELAVGMGEKIRDVDFDLIIAGSLLHDIGKLKEISQEIGFPYTTEGKLIGHITLGIMIVNSAAQKVEIKPFRLQQILHIILSHHGEKEKGSPVTCRTKEAFIVSHADQLDSIMNQFSTTDGTGWQYNKMIGTDIIIGCIDEDE